MASKKHLDSLRNVALFSACSSKELEKVAKATDEIRMTAGTLIIDQGQTGREAFIVVDGDVMVKRNNRKIATLGPDATAIGAAGGGNVLLPERIACDTDDVT